MSSLRIGPRSFFRLCQLTLAVVVVNIVTGAAVRLSDSGLGCPDWPTCAHHQLTPVLSFHPVIEFANRVVVTVLVVACAATVLAAIFRRPARKDLRWLAAGLIIGVLGEAVLGGVVVYSKLNPYVVATHFMVGMALLAVAVVLTLRANCSRGRGQMAVSAGSIWLSRLFVGLVIVILAAGAATTGTGPHAGGKGAKRIPLGLVDMTRIHAEIVIGTVVVLLVLLWRLWRTNAPAAAQTAGRWVLVVMLAQGTLGYTQFFTHLPSLLVGLHVFGASVAWTVVIWFHHQLSNHAPELAVDGPDVAPTPGQAPVGVTVS